MPRPGVTTAFATAIAARVIRPFFLYSLQFRSDTLYLCSGPNDITWGGVTWTAAGSLISIGGVSEDSEVAAKNVTLGVSGVPSSLISRVLTEVQRGLPAQIYLGLFEEDGKTIVPNPVLVYLGAMDQATTSDGGDTCSIAINLENPLADMNRPIDKRYTDTQIQSENPGDLGCSFVNSIQSFVSYFGQLPGNTNR